MKTFKRVLTILCVVIGSFFVMGLINAIVNYRSIKKQMAVENVLKKLPKCDIAVKIYDDIQRHPKNWVLMDLYDYEYSKIKNMDTSYETEEFKITLRSIPPGDEGGIIEDGVKYLVNDSLGITVVTEHFGVFETDENDDYGYIKTPIRIVLTKPEIALLQYPINERIAAMQEKIAKRARIKAVKDSINSANENAKLQAEKDSLSSKLFKCQQ